MRVTARSRLRLSLENLLFILLWLAAVGLLAWLSTRYHLTLDWTAAGRNSLSESSRVLVERLQEPVSVTAYARDNDLLREAISDLVARYQRVNPRLELRFVDPDTAPAKVRELGIQVDGEMVLEYLGRTQHALHPGEKEFSSALQRLLRGTDRWLGFLEGHGERSITGDANHDLSLWASQLESRGVRSRSLKLTDGAGIPDNTSAVVIAGPRVALLPGEVDMLRDWIGRGGNLLWLLDPGDAQGLGPLFGDLGLQPVPGVIVDPATQLFGIQQVDVAIISTYTAHPAIPDFELITVFPHAMALQEAGDGSGFEAVPLLTTEAHAWAETGPLQGEIQRDADEAAGPLTLAFALTRPRPGGSVDDAGSVPVQRLVVIGNGDFLANSYLGNAGNLDLGLSLVNWLVEDDQLLKIPARTAIDQSLELSRLDEIVIGIGHLLVLPALLLGSGLLIWMRRRKR